MISPTSIRIKTFRILIQAAREIKGNKNKTRTEYEILRSCFDPQIYAAKSYAHAKKQMFHSASKVFREADSERKSLEFDKFKRFLDKNHWPRPIPFGYRRGEQGKIQMDDGAKVVYIVFDIFLKTKSITQIQKKLSEFGHTLSEGRTVGILRNPVYYGIVKVKSLELRSDHIIQPIITKEIFEAAQDIFTQRNRQSKPIESVSSFFPLNGFVTDLFSNVNFCGYRIRKKSKNILYYKIQYAPKPINLRAEELHNLFEGHLNISYLNSDEVLLPFLIEVHEILRVVMRRFLEELEDEYLVISKPNDANDLANELESQNEYQTRKERIECLLKEIDYFMVKSNFLQFGIEVFQNISKAWHDGTYESKKNLQLLAFPTGVLFDNANRTFINKTLIFDSIANPKDIQGKTKSEVAVYVSE